MALEVRAGQFAQAASACHRAPPRARYLPIAEHGLIGDLHSAALVGIDGTIDWYCCPRFDSPSIFAAILDAGHGGLFRVSPGCDDWSSKQLYLPDTNVLITRFLMPDGVGEVHDFMPLPSPGEAKHRQRIIRRVLAVRGQFRFVADIAPRFDYGRAHHEVVLTPHGALFSSEEAADFLSWLEERFRFVTDRPSGPLQIMYRIDGSEDMPEQELSHLEGYMGSAPVRIGNGAATQLQLDIYGELMDSVYLCNKYGLPIYHDGWLELTRNVEWLIDHWDQPDEGIWETRGGRHHYTYSRLMSWVAIERAIRVARQRGMPADITRWSVTRDRIYHQIMERGWHSTRRAFVQHYDSDTLDASLLLMPLCKFVAPTDPRWLSTLDRITAELVSDSLVYRYNVDASPDGLAGEEATFSLCTFWWVEALSRAGRLDAARLAFEKMLTYANHVGLYSEEIGPTGQQLGNFPQAFTHLALISAAIDLDHHLR